MFALIQLTDLTAIKNPSLINRRFRGYF